LLLVYVRPKQVEILMLKPILLLFLSLVYGKLYSQTYAQCAVLFADNFLYFPLSTNNLEVWHYKATKYYSPGNNPQKRTEEYRYLHNGDYVKGATDLINSNVEGPAWFKNFDFGDFASAIIDVGADAHGRINGAFEWNGKLLFFNVFKNQRIGNSITQSN
jgi:hypothetical protein